MKADPAIYCILLPENPALWFKFERVHRDEIIKGGRAYSSKIVDDVIKKLGPFTYGEE